jgi:beta-1,2-mannobiose phosphorylase / 1,2-beta-oligomannan phosphorylase
MIEVKKEGIVLERTSNEFENEAVFNPAVIKRGDSVHMFYRAVAKGGISSIGYCRLDGPLNLVERHTEPLILPSLASESMGVEDPRIVKINDLYYLTYTAYDGTNAQGSLATSTDLRHFEKHGSIVPPISYAKFVAMAEAGGVVHERYYRNHSFYYQAADPEHKMLLWDKNVIFFPRRINGQLVFLHRIRPGIQIVSIEELSDLTEEFWKQYFDKFHDYIVLDPMHEHESSYIGGGCPPIETKEGWLLIYHGVRDSAKGNVYSACAALLDLDDPSKEIARLPHALFFPEKEWELNGDVNNVCFPTGTAIFGDTLFIYYGAADKQIACASVNMPQLVQELTHYKTTI